MKYLLFDVGSYVAGVEISKVIHIIDFENIDSSVAQGMVVGFVSEQDNIFPVIDVRDRIIASSDSTCVMKDKESSDKKILIIDIGSEKITHLGFIIDGVNEIMDKSQTDDINEVLINKNEVKFTIHTKEHIYPILDLSYFISSEDEEAILSLKKQYDDKILSDRKSDEKVDSSVLHEQQKHRIEDIWNKKHGSE